jgi:A/G-specific adenine glycosylase
MEKIKKVSPGKWFSDKLLRWNKQKNVREMPWKGEKDPYKIWLSEIILQQTRVEQGLNYYHRFIEAFPDVNKLAKASDQKVFKLWEGLGYYSRCRNLLATARHISRDRKGKFPDSFDEIKALKGVGPYTAAAISSFAYNLPYAVVDGNVFRVLSRVFGIKTSTDSTEGKKYFTQLANELINKKQPGIYNQAIMDFGAVICKPALPLCNECVFNKTCYAFLNNKIAELPVKKKKINMRERWFYYLVITFEGKVAVRQRVAKDIWQQLYEFPLIETTEDKAIRDILKKAEKEKWLTSKAYTLTGESVFYKQQLSHQVIRGKFIAVNSSFLPKGNDWLWVPESKLQEYPFPQLINQYRQESLRNTAGKSKIFHSAKKN